jgi:hypothetical protein
VTPSAFAAPVLVGVGLAALGFAAACAETKGALGDQCLKGQDCLSGICLQLVCSSSSPTTDAEDNAEAGAAETGPSEAGLEAANEASGSSDGGDGAAEAASGD